MEEALVRRLQAGDESAFDELFAIYQKKAVRTAALITGDAAMAEDVAQEAFVQCLLHIGELREPSRFRSWFFRTLTRSAWKAMQEKLPSVDWENVTEAATADSYPSEKTAAYEKLYRALDDLGRKQRTTVILYYFNDLSIREIAEATGSPEATVKTRLFAARRRLKQVLEAEEQKGEVVYERL
ncbi:MAG: RNA polymerase sigma factor [Anaerotignum sp.]|nr:RNA polymerase sigma factor [Anaerotignum sp.]